MRIRIQRLLIAACALLFCLASVASAQILSVSCTPTGGPTTAGVPYSTTCTASGGIAPYSWFIYGTEPAGLSNPPSVSSDTTQATISGTPTASGSYNFTVQVTDSTPVIPMTATQQFTGTVAPNITSISPTSATAGSSGFTLTVNGAGFGSDSIVNFNGTNLTTSFVNSSQVTAAVPASLIATPGAVSVTLTSEGATSNSATFTINPPPTITTISPTSATAGGTPFTLTVNGSGFGADSTVNFNGNSLTPSSINANQIQVTVPASLITTAGTVSVAVISGGVTSNSANFTISAPAITSINPATVTAGGATFLLTINGSNFVSGSVVQWTESSATTTLSTNFLSSGELTASVPSNLIAASGSAQITVKTDSSTSNAQTLTVVAGPALSGLNPNTITAGSASFTLTATGTGFVSGATVNWNGTALTTTFHSASELTAAVPASSVASVGNAQVNVTSGGVTSNSLTFAVVAAPTISSVSPNTITAGSAAFTITVSGSGFASGAAVKWNGTALPTSFVSSTQLTAAVPASDVASTGVDHVTVTSGSSTSNSVNVTVVAGPAIASLSPASTTAGGSAFTLTVQGTGFASGATVVWNTTSVTATYKSSTQLTASIPASYIANPGTVSVSVKSNGVSSNSVTFTINARPGTPSITSLSPATITGGTGAGLGAVGSCPSNVEPVGTLTINGANFASGATAKWNGDPLVTTVVSASQLTVCVPAGFIQGYGTANITVTSGSNTTGAVAIGLALPSVTITGLQATAVPTQQLTVGLQLGAAAATALSGTLQLSFTPNAAGVSSGYMDPALQFSSGTTTLNFTIPQGSTSVSAGTLQQGTVAGTITVTLPSLTANGANVLASPVSGSVTVVQLPPVINAGSVQITSLTASGFNVVLTGYSTSREMNTANFTFTAAPGTAFSGTTTFSVNVNTAFTDWYSNSASDADGSQFMLTVPFTISGPTSVLGSVSVTLTNSIGTSASQSATAQ